MTTGLRTRVLETLPNAVLPRARTFYWHLPKCGGTSLRSALRRAYRGWRLSSPDAVLVLNERTLWTVDEHVGKSRLREELALYSLANPRARLAMGHFKLSLPAMEYADDWAFVTLLRDPMERWLSHFKFNRDKPGPYRIESSLLEHVQTHRGRHSGSAMVRYFACVQPSVTEITSDHVDLAVRNARRFRVIGHLGRLAAFQRALHDQIGIRVSIPHRNAGTSGTLDELSAAERGALEQVCAHDIALVERLADHIS